MSNFVHSLVASFRPFDTSPCIRRKGVNSTTVTTLIEQHPSSIHTFRFKLFPATATDNADIFFMLNMTTIDSNEQGRAATTQTQAKQRHEYLNADKHRVNMYRANCRCIHYTPLASYACSLQHSVQITPRASTFIRLWGTRELDYE